MNGAFRGVIRVVVIAVITLGLVLWSSIRAVAQTADEPGKLRGAIDDQESGILGADIAAGNSLADTTEKALSDEAKRDLGIVEKPAQNTHFFAPKQTPAAPQAPVKPTLDTSLKSIADEIEVLEQEGQKLQQTPGEQPLSAKPTLDSSLESIAEEIEHLESEAQQLK